MPGKKTPTKNQNIDYRVVKTELLDDLEQFLLDQTDFDSAEREIQRISALKQLDNLIRQDLSYNEILTNLKRNTVVNQSNTAVQKSSSAHVIDLRKSTTNQIVTATQVQQKVVTVASAPVERRAKKAKAKARTRFSASSLKLNHVVSRSFLFAVVLLLVLLPIRGLSLFSRIGYDSSKIFSLSTAGLLNFEKGILSASENSFDTAQISFGEALSEFHQAQSVLEEYHDWTIEAASALPLVGSPLSLGKNLLTLATDMSAAAQLINQKISDNLSTTEYIEFIVRQLDKALPHLEQAASDAEKINTALLPDSMRSYFKTLRSYLPAAHESMKELREVLNLVLNLLGHEFEKRYLVLFQNNNELRATGGFIGSFALFDIYQGKVINVEIPRGGTYDLDAGQTIKYRSPKALSLINPDFNIWDANWWPDFPTSAKKISEMFSKAGGSSVNGVIAINSDVLRDLLIVIGPVEMPQYKLTVSADNLYDVLQKQIEIVDSETNEPKAIIADLVPEVMARLINYQGDKTALAEVFTKVLNSKDVQVYSTDEATQTKLREFGWAGQLKNTGLDYLQVVNTNIAGGKTDNEIIQTIDHQAKISADGSIINTLSITRSNQGLASNPFAGIDGGNVDYMRIYVPHGSELLEARGFDIMPDSLFRTAGTATTRDPLIQQEESKRIDSPSNTEIYDSLDYTVFANWIALKPGETKTVYMQYKLPFKLDLGDPLVINWFDAIFKKDSQLDNYSLLAQAQSGAGDTIFNSSVVLPDNVKVVWSNSTDSESLSVTDYLVGFSSNLTTDQYYGFIMATK